MERLLLALDPEVGVGPAGFVALWDADQEAAALGVATVEPASGQSFVPGLLELVVVPLAVNVLSTAVYDIVRRLVARCRPANTDKQDLELVELTTARGDRVVVVRLRRTRP